MIQPSLAVRIRAELAAGPPCGGWPTLTIEAAARVRWLVATNAMHPGHRPASSVARPVAHRAA